MENLNRDSAFDYDVIIIGAGHAGCEAGLAAARLGAKTVVFTLSLDTVANLPCNPCIGGSAKGQLVAEIDALGGEMGRAADSTMLMSRVLNKGKGAAVHSLRVQSDRTAYHLYMKNALEKQERLSLKQAEITEIIHDGHNIKGVKTNLGTIYTGKAIVITTGTYLGGRIHVGETSYDGAADGIKPAALLIESLKKLDLNLRRFKTGTPARIHRRSIDFSRLEEQEGDEEIIPFSFDNEKVLENKTKCYVTYTNGGTHSVITENLHRSPLYSGRVKEMVGPRYCPSIEDKVVRFNDKPRHQLFVEPMGENTEEWYLQGLSSSLPEDVQLTFMRTIEGLQNVEVMRSAYAIEYTCCDPLELLPTLEFKKLPGLYAAGQFNCTSGYEEAGAQGLVAGINAVLKIRGSVPFILDRATSYIGTLIDDLVTKGCEEPYRMMTSRSEFRLLLRQDNAPDRLAETGYMLGLLSENRYRHYLKTKDTIMREIKKIHETSIPLTEEINKALVLRGTSPILQSVKAVELLRRPQISYKDLLPFLPKSPSEITSLIIHKVETEIKYEGYIKMQSEQVERMRKLEHKKLPPALDYSTISGLRTEAREKLNKYKPLNVGQAGRIPGVNPADISVLLIWLSTRQ